MASASTSPPAEPWLAAPGTTRFGLVVLVLAALLRSGADQLARPRLLLYAGGAPAEAPGQLRFVTLPPPDLVRISRLVLPLPALSSELRPFAEIKRRVRYVVPRWWGPEMQGAWPEGGVRLPPPPARAEGRELFLSVSLAGRGQSSPIRVETDSGQVVELGRPGGSMAARTRQARVSCLWGPGARRAWGIPVRVLPPADPLPGTLRSVWFGYRAPPGDRAPAWDLGEDLEVLLTGLETLACARLQWGDLAPEDVAFLDSWGRAFEERLEARPCPRTSSALALRMEQVLGALEAFEILRDQQPVRRRAYTGPLVLRPLFAPYWRRVRQPAAWLDWKDDTFLVDAFRWFFSGPTWKDQPHRSTDPVMRSLEFRMRGNLVDPFSVGRIAYVPMLAPQLEALERRRPGPWADGDGLSARARQLAWTLGGSYLLRSDSSVAQESTQGEGILRRLVTYLEGLPPSLVRDRDLEMTRRILGESRRPGESGPSGGAP